ncbi:MAG: PilN domain-containing protein, partial [Bradyrhizobium sp.]
MKRFAAIGATLTAWTEVVAAAVIAGLDRLASPRVVRLVENEQGAFVVEAAGKAEAASSPATVDASELAGPRLAPLLRGSRVEIVLQPRRFLFRSLELPTRAAGFLDGIVRAQIDRLTPWTAADAVFGCSPPVSNGPNGIVTVIAATTRKAVMAHVDAMAAVHPAAVAILTDADARDAGRIRVFEQKASSRLDNVRLGRALRAAIGILAIVALASIAAATYVDEDLGAREAELAQKIAARRAAIRAGVDGGDRLLLAGLERRKHQTPSSVIILEALSQLLPDHTYVTGMNLAGSRLQISGITRDAPSLIPLIEQSRHFTRATFYAPTTRAPSDPGERFHIEM